VLPKKSVSSDLLDLEEDRRKKKMNGSKGTKCNKDKTKNFSRECLLQAKEYVLN
jgi:hypothetical protein